MTPAKLPSLDADLAALLLAERRTAPFPPPGSSERVRMAVEKKLAARAPATTAPPRRARPNALAALSGVIVGFGLGALVMYLSARKVASVEVVYVPRPIFVATHSMPANEPASAAVDAPARPTPSASSGGSIARLSAERALLDAARVALASGESETALQAVDRHKSQFPQGALSEEREAIAVKSLVAAGRYGEARARGAAFERRFPDSVLRRAVRSSLATAPESAP